MEAADGVHVVDTMMWGMPEQTAAFVVDADSPAVIDAGLSTDVDRVLDYLDDLGVDREDAEHVFVSHVHLDHAGGVSTLAEELPNSVFYAHPRAVEYLTDPEKAKSLLEGTREVMGSLADSYGEFRTVPEDRVEAVDHCEVFDLGSHELEAIYATGHAPHHLSFFERSTDSLFVVDEGCAYMEGREYSTTPPSDFDLELTLESFERFRSRQPERLIYGHYGVNEDGVEALDRHEEELRSWVDTVESHWLRTGDVEETADAVVEEYGDVVVNPVVQEILKRDVRGVVRYLKTR